MEASDRDFLNEVGTNVDDSLYDVEDINSSFEMTSPKECSSKIHVCKIEDNNEMDLERQKRYDEWLRNKR